MAVIELIEVSKSYPRERLPALHDISFKVEKGEILALLGPSGSGKTTTLRLIAGFESPDHGRILLGDREVSDRQNPVPPEKRGVGMVFQDYVLFPHLTVFKNVAFGLRGRDVRLREETVRRIIDLVGLAPWAERYPHELSGGQQQRVALARALAPNPIVILLDEPFSNLDPDMRGQMRREVGQILRKTGSTAILVTHDHEEAFAMADKVAVLNGGILEQLDTPEIIYHLPSSPFVADFVGQADFLHGAVREDGVFTQIGIFVNVKDLPVGAEVRVMIRPDDIDLYLDPDGNAVILARQFRGSENLYLIGLGSGEKVHSSQHSIDLYPAGTRVGIRLKHTHTVLFEENRF